MIADLEQVGTSLSALAWTYHRWGWATAALGVGSKQPTSKWKLWTDAFPPDHWVKKNWPESSNRNVGIICGQASGGLIVRDFDDAAEYHAWREQFPGLADRLPTVRTRRGFHVYLIDADGSTKSCDLRSFGMEGEIKGDGTLVVAAGSTVSKDRDGTELEPFTYRWIVPPRIERDGKPSIPMVSLSDAGLGVSDLTLHSTPSTTSKPTTPNNTQRNTSRGERASNSDQNDEALDGDLVALVHRHPIHGPGQRNAALWRMAVALRVTCGGVPDEDTIELVLRTWLSINGEHCRTREWLENWSEFYSMVERVEGDKAFLSSLPPLYESTPPPSWSASLRGGDTLERICRVVAAADQLADGRPFFLSLRTIAQVAGEMTAPTARAGIKHLIDKGLIDVVETGEARPRGKANVYQVLVNEDGSRRELD